MPAPPTSKSLAALASLLLASGLGSARADVDEERFTAAGYLRIMTRPDFQGGDGRLGFGNLYGRLLNEGPWASLALKLNLLPRDPRSQEPWTNVQVRVEGGSITNVDQGGGALSRYRVSQLAVQAGNLLLDDVTWQLGTIDWSFGDLGLYDARPTQLFFDAVGLFARYDAGPVELLVGAGDAGFALRRDQYSTVFTAGGAVRVRLGKALEVGLGGQVFMEPEVAGNRFAPHTTPGVAYEDLLRGEVVEQFLLANPGMEDDFPRPVPEAAASWKAVAYLGFGGLGPVRWNNLFVNLLRRHPDQFVTEIFQGREYRIFIAGLTDERMQLNVGDELHLSLVPGRLDAVVGFMLGKHWDDDNTVAPGDGNRLFWSTVVRGELYLTPGVHLLAETSYAREHSTQGNQFRNHKDSVFRSTDGLSDARGLEFGDADTRLTWQGKAGVVLSPLGTGIYTRPSLRLLYGVQHSSQNAAFGNSFAESLDENETFQPVERHWHHVIAVEAEAWF
jgi:hypothetical protein